MDASSLTPRSSARVRSWRSFPRIPIPVRQPAMLNFQVDDLDALLDALIAAGVEVDAKRDHYDFGDFGWFTDPEGNRVELWQPK